MDNQEKWDRRFLKIAKEVGTWSKDSTQVGAVIVGNKNQMISQGYNGFPRGIKDLEQRYSFRQTKLDFTIHAEKNCIYNAGYNETSIAGSTIYVSGLPVCHECAKAIIQVGILRVVMDHDVIGSWAESGMLSLEMFEEAGIEYTFITD